MEKLKTVRLIDCDEVFAYRLKEGEAVFYNLNYAELANGFSDIGAPVLISVDFFIENAGVKRQLQPSEMRKIPQPVVERYGRMRTRAKIRDALKRWAP